jgi:hypothetical protein
MRVTVFPRWSACAIILAGGCALNAQKATKSPTPPPFRTLLVLSDTPCTLQLDGEQTWLIEADRPQKVAVTEGQHVLICTTTSGAYKDTEEVEASASSPKQMVVKIELAKHIAVQEQRQVNQEKQVQAEAVEQQAAAARAEAKREHAKELLGELHSRLQGSFGCKSSPDVKRLDGMGAALGGINGSYSLEATVPVLVETEVSITFSNGLDGPLSGSLSRNTNLRLTSYEDALARGDSFFSVHLVAYPTCFIYRGRCITSTQFNWTYSISGEEVSSDRLKIKLGPGECSGEGCPADPHRSAGLKDDVKLPPDNPGFYLGDLYCSKI